MQNILQLKTVVIKFTMSDKFFSECVVDATKI